MSSLRHMLISDANVCILTITPKAGEGERGRERAKEKEKERADK